LLTDQITRPSKATARINAEFSNGMMMCRKKFLSASERTPMPVLFY
jgi:hypothetical protein